MSRRVAFRGKRQNRLGMFLVSAVVVIQEEVGTQVQIIIK